MKDGTLSHNHVRDHPNNSVLLGNFFGDQRTKFKADLLLYVQFYVVEQSSVFNCKCMICSDIPVGTWGGEQGNSSRSVWFTKNLLLLMKSKSMQQLLFQ